MSDVMKVLITGDSGFIGSNLSNYLSSLGIEVRGFSTSKGYDIFNSEQLDHFVKQVDLVYHCAAYAKPGESITYPVKAIDINVRGILSILEACRKYDIPLIYPSSCEIYGNGIGPLSEESPIYPTNPYAASKVAADRICYSYHVSYGMDIKNVRLFNPYGPKQQLNKIIPTMYFQAIMDKDITVFGAGKDTRDYVYISDIVNGLWLANDLPKGETINLATGQETSNLDMAQKIIRITESKSKIVFVDYPKEFGNIKNQVGTYKKAESLIGWSPKINLDEGIKKTIEWLSATG
jgi:nucleoside-diphosphate-sugar epimerase